VTVLAGAVRLRDLGEREGLGDREREAPRLDQLADLGERVDRAASVPAAEPHPVLLRATEVGDRYDVLWAARELDELGQDAAPGDVERARGRLDGGWQRGSAGEVKRRRDRRIGGQHRQLGLGRPLGGEAEHAIADGHVGNALAELVDDASRLMAHGLGELPIHQAFALLPVARVDPGRAHHNPDLAGTRMRIGEIHDPQDLRAPELIETDCLQPSLRSRPRVSRLLAYDRAVRPPLDPGRRPCVWILRPARSLPLPRSPPGRGSSTSGWCGLGDGAERRGSRPHGGPQRGGHRRGPPRRVVLPRRSCRGR
jgi:hypothetical protein